MPSTLSSPLLLFLLFIPIFRSFAGKIPTFPHQQQHPQEQQSAHGTASIKLEIFHTKLLGQISVGTPLQPFNVQFNQASNDFWVANKNFTLDPKLLIPPDNRFDQNKSQTFIRNGSHYQESYFRATGVIGKDNIQMGNLKTVSQFGMVDKYNSYILGDKVADGMFGLSIDDDGDKHLNIPRSLDLISDQLKKPIFTIWTNGLVTSRPVQGQLTLGSEDARHCRSDFVYFPLDGRLDGKLDDDNWHRHATLHSIELVQDGKQLAEWKIPAGKRNVSIPTIQTESIYMGYREGICGPEGIVRQIGKHFAVQWNPAMDWQIGKIDCQLGNARPQIVLHIGNAQGQKAKWAMKPEDYIIKLPKESATKKQECAFVFYSWGDSAVWSLQTLFMDRWCTAYNFQDNAMGFGHKKKY